MADMTRRQLKQAATPKGSKYRNVKTVHDGITFDSKREADRYVDLRVRLKAGEIRNLQMQAKYALMAPSPDRRSSVVVAEYIADFVYEERHGVLCEGGFLGEEWRRVVEDVKGKRTAMYQLKKKWLELQDGIQIREV